MALRHRIQYLRKEHEALMQLVDKIEEMLSLASSKEYADRLKGLTRLRSFEHALAGIVKHCHTDDRIVESTYHHSLQPDERMRIAAEHEQIPRSVADFREELKFATADRTLAMSPLGLDMINRLRAHIAYEREMLGRMAQFASRPKAEKATKAGKSARRKQRKPVARRNVEAKATGLLPYTLESHPEL